METTITLQQQREMLISEIAKFKAEGKEIELHNAEYDLQRIDGGRPTGLKHKDLDGQVYEVFSYYYIANSGGKRWQHAYFRPTQWGLMISTPYKKECFK